MTLERGLCMSTSTAPYFFMSYSREDTARQKRIIRELRERGIDIWVDIENLTPGTPTWEREIEKAIRGATGIIVLLSPESNNSEWVRRELSFGEQNRKRIFPVLIEGDDDTSTPLRLANHQRVDLRTKFESGLDELAHALKEYINVKQGIASQKQDDSRKPKFRPVPGLKKYGLPALIAAAALMVIIGFFVLRPPNDPPATETAATPPETALPVITDTAAEPVILQDEPAGKIVYTCSIDGDEICLINADGSNWRQLTSSNLGSFNASLSVDGKSLVYVSGDENKTEIYAMELASGKTERLTKLGKALGAPEISPDGRTIIFHYRSGNSNDQLWIMNRDGSDPQEFYGKSGIDAHNPTWSPDGTRILFAMGKNDSNKLYIMDFNGRDPKLANDTIDTRGRSDWSVNDLISFDQGGFFMHDVYLMNTDGSGLRQVSEAGMNSQGASFSPDGKWVAFTAYTNVADKDQDSCEIFIVRVDGTELRQLTDNEYCDYQPRWGN